MLEIGPNTELVLSEHIIMKAFPEVDQYYAFNVESGEHFSVNSTGCWVFKQIKLNGNFEILVENFADAFKLKKEEALADISELLEFALENKIIIGRYNNEVKKSV